jgi:poly-gamma-glutamate synthesis protein (capsule biosynthesis protein)
MFGRAVDQLYAPSAPPNLHEPFVGDAREYIDLARKAGARFPEYPGFAHPWGRALEALSEYRPDEFIVNLETSITERGDFARGKQVHYRMHPTNAEILRAGGVTAVSLANNHVMDFGRRGLLDTLDRLRELDLAYSGAAETLAGAKEPARLGGSEPRNPGESGSQTPGAGTADEPAAALDLFSIGSPTSGVPAEWAASSDAAGVWYLPRLSGESAEAVAGEISARRRDGALSVCSIHWGSNWGFNVAQSFRDFAHRLVDTGVVDMVFGHSSHHARPLELYRGHLILYGAGDLINDYEGIGGHEEFGPQLSFLYIVDMDRESGMVEFARLLPFRLRNFSLDFANPQDVGEVRGLLEESGKAWASGLAKESDGSVSVVVS